MRLDERVLPHGGRTRALWLALARAALPPGERLTRPIDDEAVLRSLASTLEGMGRSARIGLYFALVAFAALAFLAHGRRFAKLDDGARASCLTSWSEASSTTKRGLARALLTPVKVALFNQPDVKRQINFPVDDIARALPQVSSSSRYAGLPNVTARLEGDLEVRAQVVVVGSGAGGAVIAAELAERGVDVVLLEEGAYEEPSTLGRDPADCMRRTYRDGGATLAFGAPPIVLPIGRTVGGTTTINSGTCFRLPEKVRARWRELGLPVDDVELDACFARVEERISVQRVPQHLLGGSSHVVARGADRLGLSHGPLLRNIKGCQASAVCAFGCPTEGKRAMNVTYVPDALKAGARLFTGVRAERVLVEGGRAAGVVARAGRGGPTLTVRADRVVSACGTIPGVRFLSKSGLSSKHLGRHLSLHPATKEVALMPDDVEGWRDTPQGYCIDALADEGILFEGAFVPPEYMAVAFPFVGRALTEVMEDYRRMATFGFLVSDDPRGRVRALPGGDTFITYSLGDKELARIVRGLGVLAEVLFAAGAERVFLPVAGAEEQRSLDGVRALLKDPLDPWRLEIAAFHPLGTARMASRREGGVIGPDLESWELPGLYVVDGSIFPTSLGVNPQLTIMAYATRAAAKLADEIAGGSVGRPTGDAAALAGHARAP